MAFVLFTFFALLSSRLSIRCGRPYFPFLYSQSLSFTPAFSSPAFSTPAIYPRIFHSCIFHSRIFSAPDQVPFIKHSKRFYQSAVNIFSSDYNERLPYITTSSRSRRGRVVHIREPASNQPSAPKHASEFQTPEQRCAASIGSLLQSSLKQFQHHRCIVQIKIKQQDLRWNARHDIRFSP